MTSLSIGLAISAETPLLDLTPPPAPISLITVDGFPALENVVYGASEITFTLAGTSAYAGDHVIDATEQGQTATGPVNEVPPVVNGFTGVGAQLNCDGGLWAFDPDEGVPDYAFQWRRDGVDIPGATAQAYTQSGDDAGHALSCVVTASQPVGSRSIGTNTVSMPAFAMIERVGSDFLSDNAAGTEGSVTVDLSAYRTGDTILIFAGPGEYVAQGNLTLDGVAATKISTDQFGNTGACQSAFALTLTDPGNATAQIQTLNGTSHNFRAFAVYAMRGYVPTEVSADYRNSGGAGLTTSLTVSNASNAILCCVTGVVWDSATWSAVTLEETETLTGETMSTALAVDVPVGAILPAVNTNTSGRAALISVLLEVT